MGLADSAGATVGRVGQQGRFDGLNEERLVGELGNTLAVLKADLLTAIVAGLPSFQQGQHSAGQHHRVDGQRALGKVRGGAVDGLAGGCTLQRGFTDAEVGDGRGTLNRAHRDQPLEGRLALDGAFHDTCKLFEVQGADGTGLVGLTGTDNVE